LKTIVLFSRSKLVHLYAQLDEFLAGKYKVIHVAYSDTEESILINEYGIKGVINFKEKVKEIYSKEHIDPVLYNYIDELIIAQSNNRFNLNGAIQSDRTFQDLSYPDCLILAQTYYHFWDDLVVSNNVNFLIHEPTSLFFNHIAAIVCKKNKAQYITKISSYGEHKYNFLIVSADDGVSYEIDSRETDRPLSIEEQSRVKTFLDGFRANSVTFLSQLTKNEISLTKNRIPFSLLLKQSIKVLALSIRDNFKLKFSDLKQPLNHLEIFLLKVNSFRIQIYKKWSTFLFLKFDEFDPSLKYYYYPIHLEPEAVVLYWGDGIYKNQVKLIENIAAQLPPNCFLYTKDHPHADAYRDLADYKKMQAIPNLRLINPAVSGKQIIRHALGVITLNGTSGFEALLLNKQVYMFGNTFYANSKRVFKVRNIRDFRDVLYKNYTTVYQDDDDLYRFVLNYLDSAHEGFPEYFMNNIKMLGINERQNTELLARALTAYFDGLQGAGK
jgi:hypothetical protein